MWTTKDELPRSTHAMSAQARAYESHATARNRALALIVLVLLGCVYLFSTSSFLSSSPSQLYSSQEQTGYLRTREQVKQALPRPNSFELVIVADLDKKSRDQDSKKPRFVSYLQHATLQIESKAYLSGSDQEAYSVSFSDVRQFSTPMNEGGRGFELSELHWYNHKLLTFDDRTGIVFRLMDFEKGKEKVTAVPEHIVMEGNGESGKGQKHEWATVKDGELYMGSVGKEFTDNNGAKLGESNLWVAVMGKDGEMRHEDWTSNFGRVRSALGCDYPGYVVHEAIEWSSVHREWYILPRRVSKDAYNDTEDERRGSNKMLIASEDFSSIRVVEVGEVSPLRGFSSFKFVPRTQDSVIVAVKSVEVEEEDMQTSFLTVFSTNGQVLMDEMEIPGGFKYEGIAFEHDWEMR